MQQKMHLHGGHFGWFLGSCNFLCLIQGPLEWASKTFDGGMGMNMILGKDYMILTIQNHTRKNPTVMGVYWVNRVLRDPICVI